MEFREHKAVKPESPVQAMRILESMRLGMPDVAMNQRMNGLNGFDPDRLVGWSRE